MAVDPIVSVAPHDTLSTSQDEQEARQQRIAVREAERLALRHAKQAKRDALFATPDNPFCITVILTMSGSVCTMPRPKTVGELLESLGYHDNAALVFRDDALLTPDLALFAGDVVSVQEVISRG